MKLRVQYPLSSLFLAMLACAIALGWYVDSRNRRAIVGTWHYPTSDESVVGYSSDLKIRADGTFTKIQTYRLGSETFEGTYTVDKESRVIFHVTSNTLNTEFISVDHREPKRIELDATFSGRCAVDPAGYLILDIQSLPFQDNDKVGIRWETCSPQP